MTFSDAVPPLLPFIEGTYIVPQHIWSSVGDPTKFVNPTPVGTGPMKLKSFTAQQISYVKNTGYWQADKVKVDELDYPAVNSNDSALLKPASHQADWAGIFNAALNTAFVQKDTAHNYVYMVPVVPVQIVPNLKNPLLSQLPVRQAISAALDRKQMSTSGEAGLEQPATPTRLLPGQESFPDPKFNGQLPEFRPAGAAQGGQIFPRPRLTTGPAGLCPPPPDKKPPFQ